MTERIVLAIDGGASSTLALVAALDGCILGAGLAGPCNHVHEPGGMARMENALRDSMMGALNQAGREIADISQVCLGLTGGRDAAEVIIARLVPQTQARLEWDFVTALAGSSIAQPGVVVIAGTGSVAWGELADGRVAKAGGWGYLFGDEGSAYDIGRRALQAAAQADDERGAPTLLREMLLAHFGQPDMFTLFLNMDSWSADRPTIARLAALVTEAAKQGDAVALALLEQAGRDLAVLPLTVIRKLGMLEAGMNVYTTGGVFRAGEFVLQTFRATLAAQSAASHVYEAAFSPAVGALFMALRDAGTALDDATLSRIRATLPETAISKHRAKEE